MINLSELLLQELYQRALSIKSAIPHPRIMGIIRECGGKMHMAERQWAEAATDFFEAFKNYDEAGNPRRIQCLKYLFIKLQQLFLTIVHSYISFRTLWYLSTNIIFFCALDILSLPICWWNLKWILLMDKRPSRKPIDDPCINLVVVAWFALHPENSNACRYKNDPEILAMTNLIAAYQKNDIMEFEKILKVCIYAYMLLLLFLQDFFLALHFLCTNASVIYYFAE